MVDLETKLDSLPSAVQNTPNRRSFALTIAYDGTRYAGWQNQINAISVQQRVEEAVFKALGCKTSVVGSGRTDSGVHATGQVARLVTDRWNHACEKLVPALNRHLPLDISIRSVRNARIDFDPIRNAVAKRYRYTMRLARCHDPIHGRYHWFFPRPIDSDAMNEAAQQFLGCHDFVAFQTLGSPRKTTVRTVREVTIRRQESMEGTDLTIEIEADGFLYNMVRNMVGALVEIGTGRYGSPWITELLNTKFRHTSGQTAPPQGLCLVNVLYPDTCFLS